MSRGGCNAGCVTLERIRPLARPCRFPFSYGPRRPEPLPYKSEQCPENRRPPDHRHIRGGRSAEVQRLGRRTLQSGEVGQNTWDRFRVAGELSGATSNAVQDNPKFSICSFPAYRLRLRIEQAVSAGSTRRIRSPQKIKGIERGNVQCQYIDLRELERALRGKASNLP
jgi:hypothetical protein